MITPSWRRRDWLVLNATSFTIVLLAFSDRAPAENFTDAIRAYLVQRVDAEKIPGGIVVGIIDEHGSRISSYGKLDVDDDQNVDGDTLFEIGSVGKTFTAILLQDMIQRGAMKLDDPVAKYLPESAKVPTYAGKEITLRHLATHTSGLPGIPDNLDPQRADNPYADYTVEKMYAFLSGYQLEREPGAKSEYSNLGMGLLGHAIERKAGASYESLVVDRICQPLAMDSTRITLTPEQKPRFATGHNKYGERVRHWDVPTLAGAGALRSTANDMLKYVSANLGLSPSSLTPFMEKTHDQGLAWYAREMHGAKIIGHGGGTAGCNAFAGFDKARNRGVVVLTNTTGVLDAESLGTFLLVSEWSSARRPTQTKINSEMLDSYVGQYRLATNVAQRLLTAWQRFRTAPGVVTYITAVICLAAFVFLRRADSFRKRLLILGCIVLAGVASAAFLAMASSHERGADSQPGIGIRREGDRLFAQLIGSWPVDEWGTIRSPLLPPVAVELLPESASRFFERLSGNSMIFSRNDHGEVTGLTVRYAEDELFFEKTSEQPPNAPELLKPRITIKFDSILLDACVGDYEFAPIADLPNGMKLTIQREGDHLVGRAQGKNVLQGAFEIYPESETTFFIKVDGAQLRFITNSTGEVTGIAHHQAGFPEIIGMKLKDNQ